ncbi:MAG: cytochrome-c peroxidase, partial [Holophagales bacterium]|nr:cytochrome-c peroxidase [Holophagales bacterium]
MSRSPRVPEPAHTVPIHLVLAGILLLAAGPAAAQLADPTRDVPPDSDIIFEVLPEPDPGYPVLDNVEGDWVNVVAWPVRPMTIYGNTDIYALNVPGNTVGHFDASLQRLQTFRTLWAPVSVGTYVHPTDGPNSDQLLVVSHLSNALVFHNRRTGDIFDILDLPAQPADLLVFQDRNLAFVSSVATDVVTEIDLRNRAVVRHYAIPSRQPTYLTATPGGEVLVAPRWSGNNSVVDRIPGNSHNTQAGPGSILDLDRPSVATQGLDDHDLFWLDRAAGVAVPVAKGMGSLLFAHGIHPTTGELWQLNTEANNKNPALQSEPAIQGNVSFNRLSRTTLPVLGSGLIVTPTAITDLDLANPSGTHDRDLAVGNPYSLTFSSGGLAFLTGLLTDNVVVLGPGGNWIAEWDLPTGCIPRQVMLDATDQFALVYCDGLNTVPIYFLNGVPPLPVGTLDLGFDPSPPLVQEGKRLFFDAAFSANNNHSCATCHDEGR